MNTTSSVSGPAGSSSDGDGPLPLAGFTIGVTAARRAEEFAALLTRRGARVIHAPTIRILPLADDTELERVTAELIAHPADIMVATTGIGFRGWVEAAEGWGNAEDVLEALGKSRLIARGPKAKGAIRAAGLREEWSPESESSSEVLDRLLDEGVDGVRIAVQLHGATSEWEPLPDFCTVLRAAGAEVVAIPVYRWNMHPDVDAIDKMIWSVLRADLDAITFTSAPAAASILTRAKELGKLQQFVHALRTAVPVMCVGSVTASPLEALQIPTTYPRRFRLGALARMITDELPRRTHTLRVAGHDASIHGQAVLVDGQVRDLSSTSMILLKILAAGVPGRVVSRQELLGGLPGDSSDTHAVEVAVGRLRAALGDPKMIQTVVKRGYRLAVDLEYDSEGDE
ncbi:uroporphyrinogen-III synthase [Gordonia sp. ABSL49_1]|uniref:uroporphyrinogen-III synthase n=1 Tax=unclassified Gordonia (in: high G+C Gram-positive bacteria) TaxID=2657482 RepID=UPI001F0D1A7D|nr:uroporphyrinogen-III synthase [Gordonia sp. ABSL49_1]MCH5645050.1 uroporphyrinogen-III synthase [Gordonia sp. ABSL49_1]